MTGSQRKADADEIVRFIDELGAETWLDSRKRVWPNFIYHFNDVRNIASVLRRGELLSRLQCQARGVSFVDVADRQVIGGSSWTHEYVRFYFRPRTPTQYHQEGIRPPSARMHDAHCGVPVFLLFDSRRLLTRVGVEFTNGNFGATGHAGGSGRKSSAAALRILPFREIYHDEAYRATDHKPTLTYHRQAEVLVRDRVDLTELVEIICRSGAEMETLLSLLEEDADSWREKIRLEAAAERLFYRQWLYVDGVQLLGDSIQMRLRLPRPTPTFHVRIEARDASDGTLLREHAADVPNLTDTFRVRLSQSAPAVQLRCEIEGALAYLGTLTTRSLF
jgi:hypothetical protein